MKFDLLHSGIHVGMLAIIGAPVIAFATFHPVSAQVPQSTEPMEMGQAVLAAIQVHPSIRGARAQERQAAEAVEVAKAGYRPQISGGLESQINSYRNSSYDSRSVYTATLNASQMLFDFGKVAGAKKQAEAGVRASEAQVELALDEIIARTAQAWVDARTQQRLVEIAGEQLDAVADITGLVRERVERCDIAVGSRAGQFAPQFPAFAASCCGSGGAESKLDFNAPYGACCADHPCR